MSSGARDDPVFTYFGVNLCNASGTRHGTGFTHFWVGLCNV